MSDKPVRDEGTTKEHHLPNTTPVHTDDVLLREEATKLIREFAVNPPVKGIANVKAATEVFEANAANLDRRPDGAAGAPVKKDESA